MLSAITLLPLLSLPKLSLALSPKYLFSFGASYTDTGFNINGTQPSPSNPLGNPVYGTVQNPPTQPAKTRGTWSGGPNYIDFLTTTFNTTLILTYNFAYGGARIAAGDRNLRSQVTQYFSPKYSSPSSLSPNWSHPQNESLFSIFVGINDCNALYDTTEPTDPTHGVPALIKAYSDSVNKLHNFGARNFILVNIPPVDRSAAFLSTSAADKAKRSAFIQAFNQGLKKGLETFKAQHGGAVRGQVYDFWGFMTKVLDQPQEYGFADATCAGSGDSRCVWWEKNSMHTTSRFQELVARDMGGVLRRVGW